MNNFFENINFNYAAILILPLFLLFFFKKISNSIRLIDYPDNLRKTHQKPVSTIGGLIILIYVISFFLTEAFIQKTYGLNFSSIIIILSILFYLIGYYDDINNLSHYIKTFIIFFTLLIILPLNQNLLISTLQFENLIEKDILLNQASLFVTVFFIYIFFNFLNFSDGHNGIAISLSIFFIIALTVQKNNLNNFEFYFIIILFILLILNLKNILFLGNSGSTLLGVLIPMLYIYDYNINSSLLCDKIFIIFFIPGFDMTRLVCERTINKKSIFKGDTNHLHHLIKYKFGSRYTLLIYMLISIMPYIFTKLIEKNLIIIILNMMIYFAFIFFLKMKKN